MVSEIKKSALEATSINDLEHKLKIVLRKYFNESKRVGYVSGVITSDGPDMISRNVSVLQTHANQLREIHSFCIFSPTEVFTKPVMENINMRRLTSKDLQKFWRNVLGAGYVTDVFMTPRWELSNGAKDELFTAQQLKLRVHYI